MSSSAGTILITGVSGYLGSWCMQKCLEAGYSVVGTVRDPNSKKVQFLKDAMDGISKKISARATKHLTLVKADLLSGDEAWEKIFAEHPEIEYVLHTASPFFANIPKDPNEMLVPAINGTTCVLKAAMKYNVKRVVVTSSVASIIEPLDAGKVYSPEDWSNPDLQPTYGKSKTLAEKAAWDALQGSKTELCVVNPGFILGPTLYSDSSLLAGFESGAQITAVMEGKMSLVPAVQMAPVDVRDVADAHLKALTKPNAAGKRFICCASEPMWFKDIQATFAKPAGVKPAVNMPSFLFFFLQFVMPKAKMVKPRLDKAYGLDTTQTKEILDFEFTPLETTATEMVADLKALSSAD